MVAPPDLTSSSILICYNFVICNSPPHFDGVPESVLIVMAGHNERSAVRRERHELNAPLIASESYQWLIKLCVPQPDCTIRAAAGDCFSIRRECDGRNP